VKAVVPPYWTLTYLRQRLEHAFYRFTHPAAPWLTPEATVFLDKWLVPDYAGLEWGAGRSTLWFGRRVRRLTSIEHDPTWFERINQKLAKAGVANVGLRLVADAREYVQAAELFEEGSLDFVLVDGWAQLRDACVLAAIPRIREGGLLILDDAQRYLPLDVSVPGALGPDGEPLTPAWKEVAERLASWQRQVTCDGLRATVIWRRPVSSSV
jgi:SAM-dependent methyltransferase